MRESTDPQVRKAAEALLLDILQDPGTTTRVPDSEQSTLVENILEALSNAGSSRAVSVIFEVGFESNASPHRQAAAALATIDSDDVVAQALEMLRSRAEELDLEAQDSLLLILTDRPLRRERVPEIRKVLFEVVKRVPGTALTEPRQRLLAKVIDSPTAVRETEALAVTMDFSVPPTNQILTSISSVVDRRPGLAEPFASLLTAVSDGPNLSPLRPTVVAALQQLGERKLHSVCRALLRSEAACANLAEETLQPFTATPEKALQCIPIWLSLTATAKREHRISVLLERAALRAGPAMLEDLALRRLVLKPLGALAGTNSRAATSRAQAIAQGCLDSFKQGAAGTSLEEAAEQLTDSLVTCWKATRFRKGAQTFGDSLLRVARPTFLPLFLQRVLASLRSSERWAILCRTWIRDQLSREDTSLVGEAIRQAFLRTPDNEWVLEVLTALRYEVSASIAEVLQRPALSVKLKLRLMELLEQINDPADASTLMAVLPSERDAVRERAVTALGEMFSHSRTNAIPPNAMVDGLLLRLTEDPKPAVRGAAAAALGKIADQRAMDGLRASATSDHRNTKQGTTVSQIAREALTSLFDRYSAEKPSTDAPSDLASWVRLIGAIGDRRGVRLVEDLISHPTLEVRLSAVTSLGELGDDSVLPILRNLA